MKTQARVVIIGGGLVGCSVAYHLVRMGERDVVLLERDELTSGSTWHAAGNCPNFSTSWNIMKLQRYSNALYGRLAEEVDYPITRHVTGSIRLAHSEDRMREYRHVIAMGAAQGHEFALLGPNEIKSRYPFIELDDIKGGLWDPGDGDIDPSQLTQALAKGAREGGAEINRFTPVTAIAKGSGGEWRITTPSGEIRAEIVVNAAGYRAGEIAAMVGDRVPVIAMSHQYLVTEDVPELKGRSEKLPLLRDPDVSYYLRQERDGLLVGPYEWRATPHWLDRIPEDFAYQLYPDDLDRVESYIEKAIARVPILGTVGVKKVINGPIPYSPDGNPYIGPARGLANFLHCCCFSFGIVQGGGAGKILAETIVEGRPEWDMWSLDPRRYADYATKSYGLAKAVELYQNEYAIAYPYDERPAGRPAKTTTLYDRLKAKGAIFGARGGWERALYFGNPGAAQAPKASFARDQWDAAVGAEVRAVRGAVGLLDLAGFSKFMVTGPGAASYLDRLLCNALPKPGRVSLTYALDDRGGIVSEFTLTHLPEGGFYLASAASGEWHDHDLLSHALPADGSVRLDNLTDRMGTLVLAGPRSRDVLSRVTETDLANAAFPWLSARMIEIGTARVLAARVNYVGELGWEIHAPLAMLVPIYDALMTVGADFAIRDFGIYAVESMRLEKGYRSWKVDLVREYTPFESGLDRLVRLDKGPFVGREALIKQRAAGIKEKLVALVLDDGALDALTLSTVHADGAYAGIVASGGYGHALGKSLALAYLKAELAKPGTRVEIDVLGERRGAVVVEEPIYDRENARLRA